MKNMANLFTNKKNNILMLKGAYKKLKSYYYYNKNFILMRQKIVTFEGSSVAMDETFINLAECLAHPRREATKNYLENLHDKINFFVLPKKFETYNKEKDLPVSNYLQKGKNLKSVNFFIDMPIELHILDTLWTLFLGKASSEENLLSYNVYGNTLVDSIIFCSDDLYGIDFHTSRLFNIYFHKYSKWRNNAFSQLEKNYDLHRDSVLISLDIKNYFYSASCNFKRLNKLFHGNDIIYKINALTNILEKVYSIYYNIIKNYRQDLRDFFKREYPLPIGLFSSMLLGNLYLSDFDKKVVKKYNVNYYGRYVDDMIFVYNNTYPDKTSNREIINDLLIKTDILSDKSGTYEIKGHKNLIIQNEKIKIIYINHMEPKAIIDVYNKTIKIIPSQANPIPESDLQSLNFDEDIYTIEHFGRYDKLRDIGNMNIDAYSVSRYFSALVSKYTNIYQSSKIAQKEIDEQIKRINKFFSGGQCIEYYSNWMNYMYFLVINERGKDLIMFYKQVKKQINNLKHKSLNNEFKRSPTVNKVAKETLKKHLDICLYTALSLNIDLVTKKLIKEKVVLYINANMFNHRLLPLPMSNYMIYETPPSYTKMNIDSLGEIPPKIEDDFKFKWSPRFIHYEEILILMFYYFHKNNNRKKFDYFKKELIDKFKKINGIRYEPFQIIEGEHIEFKDEYELISLEIPTDIKATPVFMDICVGSISIGKKEIMKVLSDPKQLLSVENKETMRNILREAYKYCRNTINLIVLPELYFPIYWIDELIKFSKQSQIGIVTGLQYIKAPNGQVYNYIATILPFETGKRRYKNAFLYIREKNDYSPIEYEGLAEEGLYCKDAPKAIYQKFLWKGVDIGNLLCYEMTDVVVRALYKGQCDIIAAPVFNPDTTYFSNIIESTVRDLHAFIVQANTSIYGDSRTTGPYDRDNKDIFKIKGGNNDNAIIGTINLKRFFDFQSKYYKLEQDKIEKLRKQSKNKSSQNQKQSKTYKKEKPDIKRFSARFQNKRAKKEY